MSFPRYPKYKNSGVGWLGAMPDGWDTKRIRLLFEIKKRIAGAEGYDVLSITQQGIKIKDIESNDGQLSMDYSKYQFVKVGDFAMNHMDLLTGYIDISKSLGVTSPDYRVFSIRNPGLCHDRYYLYIFQNAYKQKIFYAFGQGSSQLGRWRLPTEEFNNFVVPFPALDEQKIVAAFLDRETAKIDALVEEQRRLIELLKEKRQAVISHAVTKGLNPQAKMKPSGIEWLGELPEHWSVVRLKFMAHVQGGVAKGRNLDGMTTIEVPYLRVANVQDGYLDLEEVTMIEIAEDELKRYSLQAGDVLMNEGGDFDKLGRGHIWHGEIPGCIHQNHVFAVRPKGLEPEWLNLVTSAECGRFYFMSRSKQSTNLASISSSNLQEMPVPYPPKEERLSIIECVRAMTDGLDSLVVEATHTIDLLQERRAALISAAVTGKIDVRAQDAMPVVVSKPYTVGFARQLLAAEILHVCHNHPTTGRVKLQKLIHLCEHHAEIDEIHANYLRKAAGPFDNKLMFGVAAGLSKQKWYSEVKDGNRTIYRPLEKAGEHTKYLARWESKLPRIHQVLELLGKAQTQQCEIVSTLYAAWNDLLIERQQPSDAEIIREASDPVRWHENKARIPSEKWAKALQWMRGNGLVPKGYGSHTKRDAVVKEDA